MRRIISALLLIAIVTGLCSCTVQSEDAITVDISLLNCTDDSLSVVYDNLSEWKSNHSEISIVERERVADDDILSLAVMGADHLPDVFITYNHAGRLLEEEGLVVELTGIAPDVSAFDYDGGVYAFPVLREYVSVIVYDMSSWEEGDPVGYNSEDRFTIPNCYLSSVMGTEEGLAWFDHMVAGDEGASFTDDVFVESLDMVREMLSDDIPYGSDQEVIDAYINGECSAVAVYGETVFELLESLKTQNPDLYSRTGFASSLDDVVPCGYQYGVFVRAGMSEERTNVCIDLARTLAVECCDWESDETTERLYALIDESRGVPLHSLYFVPWVWSFASDECFQVLGTEEKTSEEYALLLQNYYEMYYIDN